MPCALQAFANLNPMTYIVSAVRARPITGDLSALPIDIAAILVFDLTAIFVLASLGASTR